MKRTFQLLGTGAFAMLISILSINFPAANRSANVRADYSCGGAESNSNVALSGNWAGYAVSAKKHQVTDVQANWIVPQAHCSSGNQYSSNWVGIDGYNSLTVEQEGTSANCNGGVPQYYAWYEMYPAAPVKINNVPVHAGDSIHAETKYIGNNRYRLILHNLTTAKNFSISLYHVRAQAQLGGMDRRSALQPTAPVVERLPLTNFGKTGLTNGSATINGVTGNIKSFQPTKINMVVPAGHPPYTPKANTSKLKTPGDNFKVTWLHK